MPYHENLSVPLNQGKLTVMQWDAVMRVLAALEAATVDYVVIGGVAHADAARLAEAFEIEKDSP